MTRLFQRNTMLRSLSLTAIVVASACSDAPNPMQPAGKRPDQQPSAVLVPADVMVSSYDFRPQNGSWLMNWPGPPRRDLTYADVKHFVPTFSITRLAARVTVGFWIMEERTFWDATLGSMYVDFIPATATSPSQVVVRYPSTNGVTRVPTGAPAVTYGTFWLGCTQDGIVRGNEGKGDDRAARVYLQAFGISSGGTFSSPSVSPSHDVYCY